jgi:hypothetical protein
MGPPNGSGPLLLLLLLLLMWRHHCGHRHELLTATNPWDHALLLWQADDRLSASTLRLTPHLLLQQQR